MVSRLILNLRTQALRPNALSSQPPNAGVRFSEFDFPVSTTSSTTKGFSAISSTLIGNLGEPVVSWSDSENEFLDLTSDFEENFGRSRNDKIFLSRRMEPSAQSEAKDIIINITRDVDICTDC